MKSILSLFVFLLISSVTIASAEDKPSRTLFTNVHVFDGVNKDRIENANVLIEGNLIKAVSTDAIDADGATVIDGGGRTLMPGMADMHTHIAFGSLPLVMKNSASVSAASMMSRETT